ncbi:MAG: DUF177 domain-containing protein, partial [Pseudomonadota bacterium]|nr:DUF177 domain-containing protein [Pseudomonadota bacterium]
ARRRTAQALDLDDLLSLEADIRLAPWLDGARLGARWRARVLQTCGITLEPFETELEGEFEVSAVPAGSPAAQEAVGGEIVLEPDAPDPPDVLEDDRIDPAAYVVEHLALEIDPYPRKPDAVFEPPEAEPETSPFSALLALKEPGGR